MNIFNSLRHYAGKWEVTNHRHFNQEEKDMVKSVTVVASKYGNSACFFLTNGEQTFIPMASDATVGIGEAVDLEKAELLTLSKEGEADIQRVSI